MMVSIASDGMPSASNSKTVEAACSLAALSVQTITALHGSRAAVAACLPLSSPQAPCGSADAHKQLLSCCRRPLTMQACHRGAEMQVTGSGLHTQILALTPRCARSPNQT